VSVHVAEKDFQATVVAAAEQLGWRAFHTYDSRRSEPGFPDLVLVRERVVFVELKTERGRVSAEQAAWVAALCEAGAECHVWRPGDWKPLIRVLTTGGRQRAHGKRKAAA
jgi:hypothetical protein